MRLLRKRLSEVAAGRHAPEVEKVRLEDLIALVEADYRLNGRRSLDRVKRAFTHIRAHFDGQRAVDITADRIVTYANIRVAEGAASATVVNELAALKRGFSLAVRTGRIIQRPAFPIIRLDNARKGFFEEAEFRSLLAQLPEYLHAPMTFAYLTGWRLASEVLTLLWTQIDLSAGIVRLEPGTTKNREGREFPVTALPELNHLLGEQRERTRRLERETGVLIPLVFHRRGETIRSFRTAWRNACRRAGLVGMLAHDFRRTAVRNLERAGVPRSVAMKLVGHKTEAIYRRYAIVSQRDLAEGVAKLATLRSSSVVGGRTVLAFPASLDTVLAQSAG
jgi:integrase